MNRISFYPYSAKISLPRQEVNKILVSAARGNHHSESVIIWMRQQGVFPVGPHIARNFVAGAVGVREELAELPQ